MAITQEQLTNVKTKLEALQGYLGEHQLAALRSEEEENPGAANLADLKNQITSINLGEGIEQFTEDEFGYLGIQAHQCANNEDQAAVTRIVTNALNTAIEKIEAVTDLANEKLVKIQTPAVLLGHNIDNIRLYAEIARIVIPAHFDQFAGFYTTVGAYNNLNKYIQTKDEISEEEFNGLATFDDVIVKYNALHPVLPVEEVHLEPPIVEHDEEEHEEYVEPLIEQPIHLDEHVELEGPVHLDEHEEYVEPLIEQPIHLDEHVELEGPVHLDEHEEYVEPLIEQPIHLDEHVELEGPVHLDEHEEYVEQPINAEKVAKLRTAYGAEEYPFAGNDEEAMKVINKIEAGLNRLQPAELVSAFTQTNAKEAFIGRLLSNEDGLGQILFFEVGEEGEEMPQKLAFRAAAGTLFDSLARVVKKDADGNFIGNSLDLNVTKGEAFKAFIGALIKFALIIPAVLEFAGVGKDFLQSDRAKKNEASANLTTFEKFIKAEGENQQIGSVALSYSRAA